MDNAPSTTDTRPAATEEAAAATFTDSLGDTWRPRLNIAAIQRIRDATGVDPLAVIDTRGDGLERLANDPTTLARVMYAALRPEAERRGVTPQSWEEERIADGAVWHAMIDAFIAMIESFSPSPAQRRMLRTMREVMEKANRAMDAKVEEAISSGAVDRIMAEELERAAATPPPTPGGTSTASPGSSASTPPPSRCGSSIG